MLNTLTMSPFRVLYTSSMQAGPYFMFLGIKYKCLKNHHMNFGIYKTKRQQKHHFEVTSYFWLSANTLHKIILLLWKKIIHRHLKKHGGNADLQLKYQNLENCSGLTYEAHLWHFILSISGQDINLFLNNNVLPTSGHAEVARALCSQLWQLQLNRYEPRWHIRFTCAVDHFSYCILHCSDACALQITCRMRLHQGAGQLSPPALFKCATCLCKLFKVHAVTVWDSWPANGPGSWISRNTVEYLQGSHIIDKS